MIYCDQLICNAASGDGHALPAGVLAVRYRGAKRAQGDSLIVPWLHERARDACGVFAVAQSLFNERWLHHSVSKWLADAADMNGRRANDAFARVLDNNNTLAEKRIQDIGNAAFDLYPNLPLPEVKREKIFSRAKSWLIFFLPFSHCPFLMFAQDY